MAILKPFGVRRPKTQTRFEPPAETSVPVSHGNNVIEAGETPTEGGKHLHLYERSKTNRNVYRCVDPDCTHYHQRAYLIGKRALCYCGSPFILTAMQLRNARPVCPKCARNRKQMTRVDAVATDIMKTLFGDENDTEESSPGEPEQN